MTSDVDDPARDLAIIGAVLDRAETIELSSSDRTVAAILVGLGQAMTDEQLAQTREALWTKAADFSSLPFNFLRFAVGLIDNRTGERFEAVQAAEFAVFGEPDWDEVPSNE